MSMDLRPTKATTTTGTAGDGADAAPLAWGLTVFWHPDPARVGERAVLSALDAGRDAVLSRLEPSFAAPGGMARPLDDTRLSRRPILLRPAYGGRIAIVRGDSATTLAVDGVPVADAITVEPAQLAGGAVLLLGGAIVLLLHRLDPQLDPGLPRWGMVGDSAGLVAVRRAVARVADLDVPVLVRGATGTGKELVARALHDAGWRRGGPFLAVNMAAVPVELAAAELFGAERGAFTGADRRRPGWFTEAQGGTLFLDEIGETPEAVQPLLLRALDSGEIQPVGAAVARRVDVRLVAATDADLETALANRRFRAPLFHRLRGAEIVLPPLAERRDDIGRLLVTFLREELERIGEPHRLDAAAGWLPASIVARFAHAPWPGNIRELRGAVRQLVIANRGRERAALDPGLEALLAEPGTAESRAVPATVAVFDTPPAPGERKPADISEAELVAAMRAARFRPHAAARQLGIPRSSIYDLIARSRSLRTAADLGRDEIAAAAAAEAGHVEAMAASLEVSASALRRRMRQLGMG
jgi:two-component system nitrogen regulation response regulator GlnG